MKIYEEFVQKESKYSNRNKTDEYTINPFTSNLLLSINWFSVKHKREA